MARDENAVMYAVEQVCGLYGVQVTREQSRQFNVQGAAGRWRPMFFGTWTDSESIETHWTSGKQRKRSNIWHAGKPDFLARPRIDLTSKLLTHERIDHDLRFRSVPLWIECKALKGTTKSTTAEAQAAFQRWVERNGDFYLRVQEDVRPLITWFEEHGVTKRCDDITLASVVSPIDVTQLEELPCRWCGFIKKQHRGSILSCPLELGACATKLIGKVWSPDLRKEAKHAKSDLPGSIGAGTERH